MNIHRTDRWSLGFGVLFLIFVLWWLLGSQMASMRLAQPAHGECSAPCSGRRSVSQNVSPTFTAPGYWA